MSATALASGDAGAMSLRPADGAPYDAAGEELSAASAGQPRQGPIFPLLAGIARLKEEQKAPRAERKRVAKELKNQEKKRSRLRTKAKQLTDEDLLQVIHLRAAAKADAAATAALADA